MKNNHNRATTMKETTTRANMCNVACKRNVNNFLTTGSLLFIIIIACVLPVSLVESLNVIYAVNAGGEEHTDRNGIHYEADPLNVGISSDYGKHLLMIGRVPEQDEVLYRTERYHTTTFGYDFPADGDGDYALIMKFCEVYFDAPNRKVFDVLLNRKHTIVRQLDIYNQVGRGSAHDEIVQFKIVNGRLQFEFEGEMETSDVRNGQLRLDFIKGALDNPKINAFALIKGDITQLLRLHNNEASERRAESEEEQKEKESDKLKAHQQHQERIVGYKERQAASYGDDEEDDDDDDNADDYEVEEEEPRKEIQYEHLSQRQHDQSEEQQQQPQSTPQGSKRPRSGPRQPNPYSADDSSILMPVFIAIGAFIPLLFCLCKL